MRLNLTLFLSTPSVSLKLFSSSIWLVTATDLSLTFVIAQCATREQSYDVSSIDAVRAEYEPSESKTEEERASQICRLVEGANAARKGEEPSSRSQRRDEEDEGDDAPASGQG